MDKSVILSAAIIAGSLACTYEYRTVGVATLPQVRWTFRAEQDICCPVLIEYGVVYVGDKEGDAEVFVQTSAGHSSEV